MSSVTEMTPAIVFAIPLSILLLQVLYPLVLVSTMCLRRVRWRGIDYHLQGSWRVRLVEYVPYEANPEEQRKLSL